MEAKAGQKLIEKEKAETGKVMELYTDDLIAMNFFFLFYHICFCFVLFMLSINFADRYSKI